MSSITQSQRTSSTRIRQAVPAQRRPSVVTEKRTKEEEYLSIQEIKASFELIAARLRGMNEVAKGC